MIWGEVSLSQVAKLLQRSPWGVSCRARQLGLGSPSRSTWTVRDVAKYSGFSDEKVRHAIEKMDLRPRRAFNGSPKSKRARSTTVALTDEQADALTEYMIANPYIWTDAPGMERSTKGVWGVGKKPPACVKCGRSDRPHMARGECRACYMGKFRRAQPPSPNAKKRPKFGESVLSPEKVLQIRTRRYNGETLDALATEFLVTRQAISQIVKGMTWKHVGGPIAPYTYTNVHR